MDGGNRFYIDDTGTQVVIDGGGGNPAKRNEFQIGQLYGLDRLPPSVAAGDRIDTVRTTGYLSRGNSHGMTIYGAENSVNVFRIYSNAAPLALHGGKRRRLQVYAFKQDQAQAARRARYVLNGELSIDGGEGVNTYTTLGTEEDDAFVLTQEGLRGAGLNTRYQNIQRVNLDAREGNDHLCAVHAQQRDHYPDRRQRQQYLRPVGRCGGQYHRQRPRRLARRAGRQAARRRHRPAGRAERQRRRAAGVVGEPGHGHPAASGQRPGL